MINGQEYAWEDLQIVVEGKSIPLIGVTGIEYVSKKVHENIRGRGNRPVSMGRGQEDYEGKITILQSELEAMQIALGTRSLTTRQPFSITVAYAPEVGPPRVDVLQGVRITEVPKGITGDDTHMKIELPLAIFNIKYGAA
ncbi:MAG TPA: hypothetical protein PKE21_13840 [Flavobacteriales bacterium]|nr:hypothetical protein [Flavobacteriales bacterium]HMR28559.1 hypothetical protein [Flavobacteriales bacterium]